MSEQYSRRDFLKKAARAGTGIIAGMGLSSLLTGCEKNLPKKHITLHTLFDGDVRITKTEITRRHMGDDWIQAVRLDFDINQPGEYLFEGWVANYRARDTLGEKWNTFVDEVPYEEGRNLQSLVYRLEATRVGKANIIERDTAKFRYYGLAGSFAFQGKPIAR